MVVDQDLLDRLEKWRSLTAAAEGVPAFSVMTSGTLQAIAELLPADLPALQRIPGMTNDRVEKYAQELLNLTNATMASSRGD